MVRQRGIRKSVRSRQPYRKVCTELAKSSLLEHRVCEALGVDRISGTIEMDGVEASNLMTVTVTADSSRNAWEICNASLDASVSELAGSLMQDAAIRVIQKPQIPLPCIKSSTGQKYYGERRRSRYYDGAVSCRFLFLLERYGKKQYRSGRRNGYATAWNRMQRAGIQNITQLGKADALFSVY